MFTRGKGLLVFPGVLLLLQCAPGPGRSVDSELSALEAPSAAPTESRSSPEVPSEPSEPAEVDSPLVVLDALLQAYPDKISALEIRDGEWSILINGEPFYWSDRRMLPAEFRDSQDSFSRYSFRPNPPVLPPLRELEPEEIERLNQRLEIRETRQDARNPAFLNAIWGMDDFMTAENTVVHVEFLGFRIRVHPDIVIPLERVEAEILSGAETDSAAADWINNLGEAGAYVWRDIAGSANRSLHSYGIAVDLMPADYLGKQAYWRWAGDFYDEWWAIPYEDRYPVPETVIKAFEKNGFIWGGKWFLFDQIHFEYRPELLLLGELAYFSEN